MINRNKAVPYKSQKYESLRAKHEQLGTLFTDPIFPPTALSIYRKKPPPGNIVWKRPQELFDNPTMILENEQLNILKGKLGKTWFLTACYALCNASELWNRVIPNYRDQVWDQKAVITNEEATAEIAPETVKRKYAGIFHFQFWRFGKWIDVVVDDLLPVLSVAPTAPPSPSASPESSTDTDPGLPLFTRSCQHNEMWVSLVEKAYAKLLGSYEDLEFGTLKDALVDFTGGVSEELSWMEERNEECKQQIFRTMFSEVHEHSLVCCKIGELEDEESEGPRTEVGLFRGRTYIVTSAKKVHLAASNLKTLFKGRDKVSMICLKDPKGKVTDDIETTDEPEAADGERDAEGEADSGVYVYPTSKLRCLFSKSPEWAKVSNTQLTRLGLTCQSSNELWIPWDDLCPVLSLLTICRLFNTNVFALGRTWKEKSVLGSWTRGAKGTSADRSGGGTPHKYPHTFLRNPQYLFDVLVQEEEVAIQLIQWPIDVMDAETSNVPLAIAINVLQVEDNRKYRMHTLLECCPLVAACGPSASRELYHRGYFSRGRYILVPTTEVPGDSANYFLRVFSLNSDVKLREVKSDYPVSWHYPFLESCFGHQIFVSSVTVRRAQGLKRQLGSCNPYCVVICDGCKTKTEVVQNTRDPVWNSSFIFYRKKMEKPIMIRVYSHNFIMPDNFLGEASFPAPVNHTRAEIQADLINPNIKDRVGSGRAGSADSTSSNRGSIMVEILTEDDPMAV